MAATTTCDECGGKVNEQAWKCPHCGAKREGVKGSFTKEEMRAVLVAHDVAHAKSGIAETLIFPHPGVHGASRWLELALTIACAPLVAVGIAALMMRRRAQSQLDSRRGETIIASVMTFIGGPAFVSFLSLIGNAHPVEWTLASLAALWTRTVIRVKSIPDHSDDMTTLAKPAPHEQLPEAKARVVPRPVSGPVAVVPTAPRVEAPRAEPQTPSDDEPRLLR